MQCLSFFPPFAVGSEQARAWNLATKVMSNGVEVIVATDKSTLPGEPEVLRVLPSSPITLAPSTLTDHMMLLMPSQVGLSSREQSVKATPWWLCRPVDSTVARDCLTIRRLMSQLMHSNNAVGL